MALAGLECDGIGNGEDRGKVDIRRAGKAHRAGLLACAEQHHHGDERQYVL